MFALSDELTCEEKVLQKTNKKDSLTEVTVVSLCVDEAHGNVPARGPANACVTRLLSLQLVPGYAHTLLYNSDSVVRR